MSIDSSLCLVPPQVRKISIDPQRFWTRDPGNCNCQLNSPTPEFPKACASFLKNNQKLFETLVLDNKIVSSIQNVDGRISQKNLYNYYAKGNKNQITRNKTFGIQNTRNYTNPNTLNLAVIKNSKLQPIILFCLN